MNTKEILQHIDLSSSITKEVFSSIATSESSATKKMAIASATGIAKKINPSVVHSGYVEKVSIDDFMVFAEEYCNTVTKTIKYKLVVTPFKGLWVRLVAFLYDLDGDRLVEMSKSNDKAYFEVGDAITLAGLYLLLEGDSEALLADRT